MKKIIKIADTKNFYCLDKIINSSVDINNLEIVDKILSEYDFKVYKSIMNNKTLFDTFKSIRFFDNCEALKIQKI